MTMVEVGFFVGLGSSWPTSGPDLGGNRWGLGGFYGIWGHPSHPLSEFGGVWGVLESSHHLQVYATMVEFGFLVGLRSSWPPFNAVFGGGERGDFMGI